MPARLSGVDALSPALSQTKRQLFQPFRLALWARLAVVGMMIGEFSGMGGWGAPNISIPQLPSGGKGGGDLFRLASASSEDLPSLFILILLGALLISLFVLWIYADSVFRFILFDSVLTGECVLRAGWRRWKRRARSYFFWQLGFTVASLVALAVAIGIPIVVAAWRGIFHTPAEHIVVLVLGGLGLFLVLLAVVALSGLIALLAKDFVVPVMALEDVGVLEGWRRLLPMLSVEKRDYAGYILMKIVLAVGSAILFGIATLVALLVVFVPLGLVGVGGFVIVKAARLSWNPLTIGLLALLAGLVLGIIFYVSAFVSAPALVFFQAYLNHFFGSRYPLLGARVFPAPIAPPGGATPAPAA